MRVAVARGELLTTWEMQNYEPLGERGVEITAFGSTLSPFSLDTLQLSMRRLLCIDPYVNRSRILRGTLGYREAAVATACSASDTWMTRWP